MLNQKCSVRPVTQRELQIVGALGAEDWEIIAAEENTICLAGAAGFLVSKNKHARWVRQEQVAVNV
jgi:hypothetical protein